MFFGASILPKNSLILQPSRAGSCFYTKYFQLHLKFNFILRPEYVNAWEFWQLLGKE